MHTWLVFLHILGALAFMLAHGISAGVAFRLPRETSVAGIKTLLNLSAASYGLMYLSLLWLLVAGIAAGFTGRFWGQIWIWLSLGILILILVVMFLMGSKQFTEVRKAAGLPYFEGRGDKPPLDPQDDQVILDLTKALSPWPTTIVGMGGIAIILWLMIFKPF